MLLVVCLKVSVGRVKNGESEIDVVGRGMETGERWAR